MVPILIFLFFITVDAASESSPVILCGRELANARVALCYGQQYLDKRTSIDTLLDRLNDGLWDGFVWSGRRGSIAADWSRYKRTGLADECCLKGCIPDVILSYC